MFNNWTVFETMFLIFAVAIGYLSKNKARDLLIALAIYATLMALLA